jgi:hypothetical protein
VNVDVLLYAESKFVKDIKLEEIGYTAQMRMLFIPIINLTLNIFKIILKV